MTPMPFALVMPLPLRVQAVEEDGFAEMFATFRAAPFAPPRYSWISKKHGIVDLFVVDVATRDGEPEIVALRRNITPVCRPRQIDEFGRRAFGLSFPTAIGVHPRWDALRGVRKA